ncbi:MAG: hypothetical protein AAF696_29655 [Bacteroidota bacterium]
MSTEDPDISKLQKDVDAIDKRVIAQEHRILSVIGNLYKYGVESPDKERFKSAGFSLVSYILRRQTAVIFTALVATFISIGSLLVAIQSRDLLSEQNSKIDFQNKRIVQQNQLLEAERRSSLVFLFNNVLDALDQDLKNPVDSLSALRGFDGTQARLSKQLVGRIIALSRRLVPYRPYDYVNDSLSFLRSPERGQLLIMSRFF